MEATRAGTCWTQGQLGVDHGAPSLMGTGGLIAEAVVRADLAEGANVVRLPFEGLRISAAKQNGPYVLKYLSVTDVDNPEPDDFVNNSLGHWQSRYTTDDYRSRRF